MMKTILNNKHWAHCHTQPAWIARGALYRFCLRVGESRFDVVSLSQRWGPLYAHPATKGRCVRNGRRFWHGPAPPTLSRKRYCPSWLASHMVTADRAVQQRTALP